MSSAGHCQRCRSKDFLGIECGWPATDCLAASHARRRQRGAWTRRLCALAVAAALLIGVWQWMA